MKRKRVRGTRSLAWYLSGRQTRRRLTTAAAAFAIALLVWLDRGFIHGGGEVGRYEGRPWRVVRVIDGDTLDIDAPDTSVVGEPSPTTRVRLWGIDAPERVRPDVDRPAEPIAAEAHEFVRDLCEGHMVTLQLQSHQVRGNYGRLLAYVVLSDGSILNERLLVGGLARADDRFSHQWNERFALLEDQARKERVGMWGRR